MKKTFKILSLLLVAVLSSTMLLSCDDKDDDTISVTSLPEQARAFISQYFPSATVMYAQKDNTDFEVTLSDGTKIEFNSAGEWTDVDAASGKTIPNGFYPADIDIYIGLNYDGAGINGISKEPRGYDVELVSGLELIFNQEGSFIGIDK